MKRLILAALVAWSLLVILSAIADENKSNPAISVGRKNELILRRFSLDRILTYQGILKNSSGDPVPDANYNLTFRLYNQPTGGALLWTSSLTQVTTSSGYFTTQMGPIPLRFDSTYYLSLQVQSDPEMATREKLTSSPYAVTADTSNYAFKADTALYAMGGASNWTVSNSIISTNGYWGIARGGGGNNLYGGAAQSHTNLGNSSSTGANGYNNSYCTVTGGYQNTATASYSSIVGGGQNEASGQYTNIGGGQADTAKAPYAGISSGYSNLSGDTADDTAAFIGGGMDNSSTGMFTVIGGGRANSSIARLASILGGEQNQASSDGATIGGGVANSATNTWSVIGGGTYNTASGDWSFIGGGGNNVALGGYSVVAGGGSDTASGWISTIAGGTANKASGQMSSVGGGNGNSASGFQATVCGGCGNIAAGERSSVGGGLSNQASGYASAIAGGIRSVTGGDYSTILGGEYDTIAVGSDHSMVFGSNVYINQPYRIVFFDGSNSGHLFLNADNRNGSYTVPFVVGTNSSNGNGAYLTMGGTWTNGSSRTFKENFIPFDGSELLRKIANLSVTTWNYKQSTEKHIGPVAEDFVRAFDTGIIRESDGKRDNLYLSPGDEAGVALAGVQELLKQNEQMKNEISELRTEIEKIKAQTR